TQGSGDNSPSSKIYNLISAMRESGAAAVGDGDEGELSLKKVRERVVAKGFTDDQLMETINEYEILDVSLSPSPFKTLRLFLSHSCRYFFILRNPETNR